LVGVTLAVFSRTCFCEFTNYDDDDYVYENREVLAGLSPSGLAWALTTTEMVNWHPLTWISFQADASLFGIRPWGYHLTNSLLHAAATALLFEALFRMTGALWRSALVAALFGLHPLHVESVAWVSERKDVLSGFFCMLTLFFYASYVSRPSWLRYLGVVVALALGLASKSMLVTLPFVLLLLDYWPLGRLFPPAPGKGEGTADRYPLFRQRSAARSLGTRWLLLEKLPLFALAAASTMGCDLRRASTARSGSR
jgi:hypothetical protein